MLKRTILLAAVAGMVLALPPAAAQAELVGQLGLLDLTADYGFGAGVNPGTEAAWAPGDIYHLIYVTSTERDATSAEIADYNAFVQADADAEGLGASVGVSWSALGSTATVTIDEVVIEGVDAIDNAIITGPVFGIFGSGYTAKDAADFWDLIFPSSDLILTLAGDSVMAFTGTGGGGTADRPLGTVGSVQWEWTAWGDWANANKWTASTDLAPLCAISSPLEVVPEPATLALLGLGGLGLILGRKRR